jgi:hypothetical protein
LLEGLGLASNNTNKDNRIKIYLRSNAKKCTMRGITQHSMNEGDIVRGIAQHTMKHEEDIVRVFAQHTTNEDNVEALPSVP